jgi:serine/threonine protein kinase
MDINRSVEEKLKEIEVDVPYEVLGWGGYGTVFKGKWNNNRVAVKRIDLFKTASYDREEAALKTFGHPNVIKLFHVESDDQFR